MKGFGALAAAALALTVTGTVPGTASAQATKPVQLSKVVLNPDIDKTAQKVKVGTICLFSGSPLNFGANERSIANEAFERLFNTTMEKRGYIVVGKSTDMFEGEGKGPRADFLIGATFKPVSVAICDSVKGQKGTIGITVEWKIFDRAKQEVVATVTSNGEGTLLAFGQNGLRDMIDQAFVAAVNALVDQGALDQYLGKPKTPA